MDTGLRHRIVRRHRISANALARTEIDDVSATLAHTLERRLVGQDRRAQIGVEDLIELVIGQRLRRTRPPRARRVQQDIESTQNRRRLCERLLDRSAIARIARHPLAPSHEILRGRCGMEQTDHIRPGFEEGRHCRRADATGRPGHHRAPTGERPAHRYLSHYIHHVHTPVHRHQRNCSRSTNFCTLPAAVRGSVR